MLKNHWNTLKICFFGQTTKQPLSNFELWKSWKCKQLWGVGPDPSYLQSKCIIELAVVHIITIKPGSCIFQDVYCSYFFSIELYKQRCVGSNHRSCSVKKDVLKMFANFTGKHLCWSLVLVKLQAEWLLLLRFWWLLLSWKVFFVSWIYTTIWKKNVLHVF